MDSLAERFKTEVFDTYLDLLKAQYRFHPQFSHAKHMWEKHLTMEELVRGPYLEKAQMYEQGEPLDNLPLHEKTRTTLYERLSGRSLYRHQTDALKLLLAGQNAIIATGTSSGKTLCYQIPILDDLLRDPSPGLRAIIIYPLNALVNDQLAEWEQILKEHSHITFARFTGQTPNSQERYEERLKAVIEEQISDEELTQQERQREVERRLKKQLHSDPQNRLNHRDDIRANPPQVLITNFSMLEYLMERPVDVPIFENAHLKFLVLDEVHAYRGVQATEIAFLIRRLKDRLGIEKLVSIATSATLGKQDDSESKAKVRRFVSDLFGENFIEPNPIYGTTALPKIKSPSFRPPVTQYINAAEFLRVGDETAVRQSLCPNNLGETLADLLECDENLYRLRKEILTRPLLLSETARRLWPNDSQAKDGIQALLEIVATAKKDETHDDLLPTRLHYFVRAQDGLHVCLHLQCPDRSDGKPEFFASRNNENIPEGLCPACHREGRQSKLVEIVTCRKCGYLYGALQDLGPRRAQNPDADSNSPEPQFDSFSTELEWAADSFWSYFSVERDLPYPLQPKADDEDEDQEDLSINPAEMDWCVRCGKKNDKGRGDNCQCPSPHLRKIKIFHRQCHHSGKPKDFDNLYSQQKKSLTSCPNCGARNGLGLEPVRRFQESDDETGLAMAIPLSHFQVSQMSPGLVSKPPRKLLCFTDHRQRAAAFPALLEEETFTHDLGRMIVKIVHAQEKPLDFISLGEALAERVDPQSSTHDPNFFLPASRFPDEELDAKGKRNLWIAETFSYFGIPDSARESAEDLGLVAVEYRIKDDEKSAFHELLARSVLSMSESTAALQVLLGFVRQRKAFTLPEGRVEPDATAFGRVTADISYALHRKGLKNTEGWLPRVNKGGGYRDNFITDYLRRLLDLTRDETLKLGETIWEFLTSQYLLIEHKGRWKLDHERLLVVKAPTRHECDRCGIKTAYAVWQCCPRKACVGKLQERPFEASRENIITRWVAGAGETQFTTLKSEEHTAQINKDLAKTIEDEFRADGVNLLSSTTTFEMGINIGDLQKVLLRNAPPSSANYVQRIGRSGRGKDKNAVCVTLCRRTKYDADAWDDPPNRLMSGEVRTPTVFMQNRVIAQRHLNAVAFSRFLRIRFADKQSVKEMKQQIHLEAFLSLDSRVKIPDGWFQINPATLYLDFPKWLETQKEDDIFQTQTGRSLLGAVGGFEAGQKETRRKYEKILKDIENELAALMSERDKLYKQGYSTVDVDRAVKNLLHSDRGDVISILAKRGFLPRYAFPLDVVTLETGWSRWSRAADVELNRDRGIAIAEFAPGAQVIAHKKVFTSAGLYVVSRIDRPDRLWYAKCPDCKQIRTEQTRDQLLGSCSVCQRRLTNQHIKAFVEPNAFSVRIENGPGGAERHRRTSLVRQRQTLTHFIDSVEESRFLDFGLFSIAQKEDGNLFRYNLGPENKGFVLCPSCGYSDPQRIFISDKKHKKLRRLAGSEKCEHSPWGPLAYGHRFKSFCLIARSIDIDPPVESLAFALRKGLCHLLDIEASDIGVSWRWVTTRNAADGSRAEIILYDRTPGGAGFVKDGFENWSQVVEKAHEICNSCKCEEACYDCLKDYGNQSHHEKLSRQSVRQYLKSSD